MQFDTHIGIELENPFILASGILDENGYTIKRILESGAGAAVTKSIGSEESFEAGQNFLLENHYSYMPEYMGALSLCQ